MNCTQAETLVHAFVDGELMGQDRESYERHLGTCDRCRDAGRFEGRFKAAVRAHLPRRPVPPSLERRLDLALAALPLSPGRRPWSRTARLIPALAVAAGVIVVVAVPLKQQRSLVLDLARRTYQTELPLDVVGSGADTDCRTVASWFRGRLDFPVHPPQLPAHVTCQGGRLVNVGDQPAAYLVYQDPGGRRVSVLVFNPEAVSIDAPHRRMVNGHEIFYRSGPGISTAAYLDRRLGYAITSERDEESLLQLVSAGLH